MNGFTRTVLSASITHALSGYSTQMMPAPNETQREYTERESNTITQTLKSHLIAQLKSALDSGELTTAVSPCQSTAQPIMKATTQDLEGVTIRRTLLRLRPRNPADVPDSLDLEVLINGRQIPKTSKQPLDR